MTRTSRDARFDDLIRKYFVAGTRAKQVLMLVADTGGIRRGTPNVAAWSRRDQTVGPRTTFTVTIT
jgi:hypothetical protein